MCNDRYRHGWVEAASDNKLCARCNLESDRAAPGCGSALSQLATPAAPVDALAEPCEASLDGTPSAAAAGPASMTVFMCGSRLAARRGVRERRIPMTREPGAEPAPDRV